MTNEYGLDVDYFRKRLKRVLRGIERYTPEELARELARTAATASQEVLNEPEFKTEEATQ
ncbi:hypothetical protein ACV1DN_13610 [Aeromonas allosaccharophila]